MRRWPVLVLVVALVAGIAAIDGSISRRQPAEALPAVASLAAPVPSQSSTWYCTGETGSGGIAQGTLLVTNTGTDPVAGILDVTSDAGATGNVPVNVPASSQLALRPATVVSGSWLASTIRLAAGGVVVSQQVQGPTGWSQSPCASAALPDWYFASGSTSPGAALNVTLFNPTPAPAVVDLTFTTGHGTEQPLPYQGIVVEPGQLVALDVGTYVQDEPDVSTAVTTRSGHVVAEQLEALATGSKRGLSLRLGAPAPRTSWSVPDVAQPGAAPPASELSVFNPTAVPQVVHVSIDLASGSTTPPAPFVDRVMPGSTWRLRTDLARRVPAATDVMFTVQSGAGPGVVVDRAVTAQSGPAPQWGVAPAIDPVSADRVQSILVRAGERSTAKPAIRGWALPSPGPSVAGASASALLIGNLTSSRLTVRVFSLDGAGLRRALRATVVVAPHRLAVLGASSSGGAPASSVAGGVLPTGSPLVVEAVGALAVSEVLAPAGALGVVSSVAVPLG